MDDVKAVQRCAGTSPLLGVHESTKCSLCIGAAAARGSVLGRVFRGINQLSTPISGARCCKPSFLEGTH
eukprot:1156183-Pelagomonas_calceolata.AAC.20